MKIVEIELYHVNVPLRDKFYPAWIPGYLQTSSQFTLIKLVTDEGIVGYSAGLSMGHERQGLGELLGAYFMGADPTDIVRIQNLLEHACYLGWRNYWIEPACWDIVGKLKNKPVYELLGGEARPLDTYCSFGELYEPEKRVDVIHAMQERGFKTFKLRAKAKEFKDDVRLIEGVRKGVGDGPNIAVDVNQAEHITILDRRIPAWDLKRATDFAAVCADNRIEWLEEPLHWHNYNDLAALKKVSRVKIAGGEMNYGWDDIKIMFEKDCYHMYQPDAMYFGGIAQVKQVIDACHQHNREYSPHTWTNGIGYYVNWNMMLADKNNLHPLEYSLEEPGWVPEIWAGVIEPIIPDKNGQLHPFKRPGLGFEIDKKLLKKYGKRYYHATAGSLAFKVIREKGLKTALEMKKIREAQ